MVGVLAFLLGDFDDSVRCQKEGKYEKKKDSGDKKGDKKDSGDRKNDKIEENNINIDFESEEQFVNLQIINIRGQQIFIKEYKNTKNVQLNIEDFSSGVYFVKIITNNGFKTVKFVKK